MYFSRWPESFTPTQMSFCEVCMFWNSVIVWTEEMLTKQTSDVTQPKKKVKDKRDERQKHMEGKKRWIFAGTVETLEILQL